MSEREMAIKTVKDIIELNKDIGLALYAHVSSWTESHDNLTPKHWQSIGRMSALGAVFKLTEEDLK